MSVYTVADRDTMEKRASRLAREEHDVFVVVRFADAGRAGLAVVREAWLASREAEGFVCWPESIHRPSGEVER